MVLLIHSFSRWYWTLLFIVILILFITRWLECLIMFTFLRILIALLTDHSFVNASFSCVAKLVTVRSSWTAVNLAKLVLKIIVHRRFHHANCILCTWVNHITRLLLKFAFNNRVVALLIHFYFKRFTLSLVWMIDRPCNIIACLKLLTIEHLYWRTWSLAMVQWFAISMYFNLIVSVLINYLNMYEINIDILGSLSFNIFIFLFFCKVYSTWWTLNCHWSLDRLILLTTSAIAKRICLFRRC